MISQDNEYVEFTKICGDCGKRFKDKIVLNAPNKRITKEDARKLMDVYSPMFNVACKKCSEKKQ